MAHLVGRVDECRGIDALLAGARAGSAGTLVIRGEAGVGKTALADYAMGAADDLQVVHLTGIEAERELGYAALYRLLTPIVHRIDRLPELQHEAMRSAFGMGPSLLPADRFMVGLATVTMAAESASFRPLLCVIDDAQWVDRESIDALVFWARRLQAERCALIFCERDQGGTPSPLDGLPVLALRGLAAPHAHALLDARAEARLDRRVADHLVAETAGNPLALLELAGELSGDQLSGGAVLPHPLPMSHRLERRFSHQARALPTDSQTLLLLAAAEPTGDAALLWRAAPLVGVSAGAAGAAEDAGLLTLLPRVEFRHPLIRSAIYSNAAAADRRHVHAALAAVTDDDVDADRRAWHLAAAAVGPDEATAATLEDGARRAHARGSHVTEVAFLTRSAELTPDRQRAAIRRLAAADAALAGGSPVHAQSLLALAGPDLRDPASLAGSERLEGASWALLGRVSVAAPILLSAAVALAPLDGDRSRRTMLEALEAACLSGGATVTRRDVALAAAATRDPSSPGRTAADLLLDGFSADLVDGYAAGAPVLRRAVAAMREGSEAPAEVIRWSTLACNAAQWLWDQEAHRALVTRMVDVSREVGSLHWLHVGLSRTATAELWAGRLRPAEALGAEADDVAAAAGEHTLPFLDLELLALRGRDAEARVAATSVMAASEAIGFGTGTTIARAALVVLGLGTGRYGDALTHAEAVFDDDPVPCGNQVLPDLVEAAVRRGDHDAATRALDRLTERATAAGGPWALGLLARSRALVADDDGAERLYAEALDALASTTMAIEVARTHLLHGEWLRRQKRRTDARNELRAAHEAFVTMGVEGFAQRARNELLATGEHARKRTVATTNDLTPQEANIARLASTGETNSEIAARLFISASTVEYHLRKVFRKLAITSRRQLRDAVLD